MEQQSVTLEQILTWKQSFLIGHNQYQRPTLQKLWKRLEIRFEFFVTLEIMQKLSENYEIAQIMLQMPEDEFFANFVSYKPSKKKLQSVPNNQKMVMQPQEKPISNKDKIKQTQSLMIPQKQQKMQIEDNIDITVYSKFLIENNIEKNSQFNRKFKQEDFESFFHFQFEYQQSKLLTKSEIRKQVQSEIRRQNHTLKELKKQILITDSALYYTSPKHRLRPTQILAIYIFLSKPQLKKTLLQILTGEGKSTTIACLSAILVMRGLEVDIITTSPILVKRDVQQKRDFFNLLGMKINHNVNEDTKDCLKPKECYAGKNVVMGTPFSFQVDLLYDEYQQKGTRNKRPYKVAIIDEVDSMLIDEKSNQTLLASSFAGFSELILPMRIIWQKIVSKDIIKEDDKIFLYEKGQKQGEIIKGEANQVMRVIIEDLRKKFNNQFVPKWRLEFIEHSLEDWIHSAITAAHIYIQNHHYIVEKGKIVPVNYRSNGVLQRNVHWQNGLHQFLQMKHGLHVQTQTMTSNFMSNIGHFTRYQFLYGLTGTLGSPESKIFLQYTYDVEMLQIPPYMERRLKIQPGYLMFADLQWIGKIVQQTQKMIDGGRAVLIICQTIQDTQIIQYALKQKKVNYKSLCTLKTGQQNHQDTINSREIIIATNVAGRGTDIKAKKQLIQKGGLHVIISFMPQNYRVEMQARGRAGRNGAPGSSQLIVNYQKYCEQIGLQTFQQSFFNALGWQHDIGTFCQNYRDKIQAQLMKNDKETVKKLKTKDKMFKYFCQAVKKIPDYMQNTAKKHAIEQTWAMFLKKVQLFKCSDEQMEQQAQNLANEFIKNSEGYYNPSHGVWRGLNSYNKNNFDEAKNHFKTLQSQDSTKINKIAGCLLESAVRINQDDKKKKSDYQNSVNLLQTAFKVCEQKKQIQKANHALRMTVDNQNSLNLLQNQAQRHLQQSINMISKNGPQALNSNFTSNERVNEIQRRQMNRLMNSPSINILTSIQQHIKTQVQKIANVKADEYVQMNLKSLKQIINLDQKDQKNLDLKEAYENLAPDLPYVPQAQIKKIPKKKTPWWKRALVFCLGVVQICVGSLIVAASGGAAASFGAFMIFEGLSDCYKALFSPELCNDLKAYFTEKVLSYSISLATIGLSGIQQLAKIGKSGFSIIKNSSMRQIFKKTIQNISTGFAKGIVNYQGAIKQQIFKGVSSQLNQKKQQIKPQDIFRVVKQPDFQKKVKQAQNQQEKLQFDGKKIQQKFSSDFEMVVKSIIDKNLPKFIQQTKNLNLKPELVSALIKISFQQTFEQNFHKSQSEQNKIMQKKIFHFVSKNLHDQKLAQKVIAQFKIQKLILDSMKNISKNQYYDKLMKQSKIDIYNNIIKFANQLIETQKTKLNTQLQAIKAEANLLNTSAMTPDQYNTRVNQYNTRVQNYKNKEDFFNKFIKQFNQQPKDQKMIDKFINKGIIQNGKINKNAINSNNDFHPFLKQVLLKLEDIQTSQKDFKEDFMNITYNTFTKMVINSVNQVIDNSSNSVSRLKDIENKLYKDLFGNK